MLDAIVFVLSTLTRSMPLLGIACWVMAIFESALTWMFVAQSFSVGPVLLTQELKTRLQDLRTQQPIPVALFGLATARFKSTSDSRVLVHFGMPFLVKGTLEGTADGTVVNVRTSLGGALFLACWVTGWTASALRMLVVGEAYVGLGLLLLGWLAAGAISWGVRSSELRKARRLVAAILPDESRSAEGG